MKYAKQFAGLLVLVFAVCLLTTTQAQDRLVEDVELRGYRSVTVEELLKYIKTKPGEKYDEAQVKRDFEQLLTLEIFDKFQSKVVTQDGPRGGVVVSFVLKEHAKR